MSNQLEDQMALISQLYPGMYSQIVVPPQETKPRRRRKKSKAGETSLMKKRKLNQEQVDLLEQNFGDEHKLESERKDRLASELGLDPRQVAVWFQNRRARWKNKKVEEEYSKLKSLHESTILDKCRLESEVLQLKQQLSEAEKEIQRLSSSSSSSSSMDPRGGDAVSSNSPISSSVSMDATDPPAPNFIGELGDEDLLMSYMAAAENSYIIHGMEWLSPYM